METVGQRIEAIAREKGLPGGQALAGLFGVSYETLRKWRAGDSAPNRERQRRVSEVLGVQPEVFMHGAEVRGLSWKALKIAEIYDSLTDPLMANKLFAIATAFDERGQEPEPPDAPGHTPAPPPPSPAPKKAPARSR